jgi:hypothetical protein
MEGKTSRGILVKSEYAPAIRMQTIKRLAATVFRANQRMEPFIKPCTT